MKTITCRLCGASFVQEEVYEEQQYCKECLSKYPSKSRMSVEDKIALRKFKKC